jgi:hypothetical protein
VVNPNPSQPTLSPPSPPPLSSYIPAASL